MRRLSPLLLLAFVGCASTARVVVPVPVVPPGPIEPAAPSATELVARADALVAAGDFAAALTVYDEVLRRHPHGALSERARMGRTTVATVLAAREELERMAQVTTLRAVEIARLQRELQARAKDLAALARELSARETELLDLARELTVREEELARARQDLASRQSTLSRLAAETERLRTTLEDLKRLDLQLEKRR